MDDIRRAGIELANDIWAPNTAKIIANNTNCYPKIFRAAVKEIGTAWVVAGILAAPTKYTPKFAYRALFNISDLTPEERQSLKTTLIAKTDAEYAYRAFLDISDLTPEERQSLKAILITNADADLDLPTRLALKASDIVKITAVNAYRALLHIKNRIR